MQTRKEWKEEGKKEGGGKLLSAKKGGERNPLTDRRPHTNQPTSGFLPLFRPNSYFFSGFKGFGKILNSKLVSWALKSLLWKDLLTVASEEGDSIAKK